MSTEPSPTDLVELYVDQGLSLAVIGRRFGHTADWVRARLVAAGVPLRPQGRRPTITDDQVRSLLDRGLRVAEIAAELGVTDSSVLDRMRARGWTGPPRRPRGPSRNSPPAPRTESLRQLYVVEGLSVAEVALRLGLSRGRVTAALEDAGISRRRPGWTDGAPPDPITSEQLHELYVENGGTVREVAAALETTTTRVNAALRRHGIPRRPEPQSPPPPLELDRNTLTELYVTRRLDDEEIGAMHQVPAYRVTMRRRELDVHRPQVAPPHPEPPAMPPASVLHDWYVTQKRTLEQIARQHHTTRDTVRTWLQTAGIPVQPRTNREHRKRLDPVLLRDLYLTREWSAAEIAAELDTTIQLVLRALHDHGIPVRPSGPPRKRDGDQALRRLTALYQDPDVAALLRRHRIPTRPEAGTITERFPTPVTLTRPFLAEAYSEIGLATAHIEQLTGQPAEQVLQLLHEQGIPVRSGAQSPWLRRQRN
jgi:transposase-like protein